MEEKFGGVEKKLNVFNKVIYSLINPTELFKVIRKEEFSSSFLYLLFVTSIPTLIKIVLFLFGITSLSGSSIGSILKEYTIVIIGAFIYAGVFHLFAKLFGGVAGYGETYKAYVYGFTASTLFGWIPFIGILGIVYGVYCFVKGISILHGLSTGKAFLVWFMPILIVLVILVFLLILWGVAIYSFLLGVYSQNPQLLSYLNETGEFVKVLTRG